MTAKIAVVSALFAAFASAQEFEVASIKLSGPRSIRGSEGGPGSRNPGRYSFGQADLLILLMIAYDVEDFQISSRFDLSREEIDLAAKVPTGTTKEQFRVELQNLLAQRFNLRLHTESKEFPAFALTFAKAGPKLKAALPKSEPAPTLWLQEGFPDFPADRPGFTSQSSRLGGSFIRVRIKCQQQSMGKLASSLRRLADRPVVDNTGLAGNFDFTLEFAKDVGTAADSDTSETPPVPALNAALQEQLGLQLIGQKIPFRVLVIDAVDRFPTAN